MQRVQECASRGDCDTPTDVASAWRCVRAAHTRGALCAARGAQRHLATSGATIRRGSRLTNPSLFTNQPVDFTPPRYINY